MLCAVGSGFCGGAGTNAVYTLPAPVAPEDVPEYEYLGGCKSLQLLVPGMCHVNCVV
jgi:hypothetical protein